MFCFLSLLEFLFKAWFPPLVFAKVAYIHQGVIFLYCMCLMNSTRKKDMYSLAEEVVQCHNKWKLMCVTLCVCFCMYVCVMGNTSPINSVKAEDKLGGCLELIFRPGVISTLGLRWIDNTFSSPLSELSWRNLRIIFMLFIQQVSILKTCWERKKEQ